MSNCSNVDIGVWSANSLDRTVVVAVYGKGDGATGGSVADPAVRPDATRSQPLTPKTASKAQPPKLFGVALPVLGDLDPQVQVHLGAQQLLDLRARGGARPRAAWRRPCRSRCPSGCPVRRRGSACTSIRSSRGPRAGFDLLDDDGQRVRQLVAHAFQRGLADQLGHQHFLGLVGEFTVGIERRARRQLCGQHVDRARRAAHRWSPTPERSRRRARPNSSLTASSCAATRSLRTLSILVTITTSVVFGAIARICS